MASVPATGPTGKPLFKPNLLPAFCGVNPCCDQIIYPCECPVAETPANVAVVVTGAGQSYCEAGLDPTCGCCVACAIVDASYIMPLVVDPIFPSDCYWAVNNGNEFLKSLGCTNTPTSPDPCGEDVTLAYYGFDFSCTGTQPDIGPQEWDFSMVIDFISDNEGGIFYAHWRRTVILPNPLSIFPIEFTPSDLVFQPNPDLWPCYSRNVSATVSLA